MLKNGLLSHPGAATAKSMNAGKRIFQFQDSGAGVWHTFSRIIDRAYLLNTEAKDFLLKTICKFPGNLRSDQAQNAPHNAFTIFAGCIRAARGESVLLRNSGMA